MIDITHDDVFLLDGQVFPVQLLRALLPQDNPDPELPPALGRVRAEFEDGRVQEMEVRREGKVIHFLKVPRQDRVPTDAQPVEREFRAQLVSPDRTTRTWVDRGEGEDASLRSRGWTETGLTRPRVVRQVVVDPIGADGGKR